MGGTIRCRGDNSVSVHHYCFPYIRGDNSVSVHHYGDNSVSVHHYCFPYIKSVSWIQGQFGVSSSLLLFPLHQVGGQFGVSSSLLLRDNSVSVHHYYCFPYIKSGDNSVSVHHYYCFPYIKSVSWIYGGDNSVSGGQFGVSSSLLFPLHQVGKLDSGTIRCQFIIIIVSLTSSPAGQFGVSSSLLLFPLHQVLHFPRSRVARQASRASLGPSK